MSETTKFFNPGGDTVPKTRQKKGVPQRPSIKLDDIPEGDKKTELGRAAPRIRRYLGNVEVRDAEHDLRVFILPEDTAKATKRDPGHCVFAQACIRTFRADLVMFWRSRAFVKLPDSTGVKHVERYVLPKEMRALIRDFDEGKGIIPEAGFLLKAPALYQRLENEAKSQRERKHRIKREILNGTRVVGTAHGDAKEVQKFRHTEVVRNGSGAIHFSCKKKDK